MSNLIETIDWQPAKARQLPTAYAAWLLYAGSFMERLKTHGVTETQIDVLQQDWRLPTVDEANCLKIAAQEEILAREVLILSPGKKWMYARTIFPAATLTGAEKELAHLNTKSLGSVLFKQPDLVRSEFVLAHLTTQFAEYARIKKAADLSVDDLWARRSLFTVNHKSLLLTEVFFPDVFSLCNTH